LSAEAYANVSDLLLDWRDELKSIGPYLDGRGGRVCVTGTATSGVLPFMRHVCETIRRRHVGGLCVKIDPQSDENTHYPADIVAKLEQKLRIVPPVLGSVTVASDLDAGGSISLENVDVHVGGGPWAQQDMLMRRTRGVVGAVREWVGKQRFSLVLHECQAMEGSKANWFWHTLWGDEDGLQGMAEQQRLVLICCCESDGRCPHRQRVSAADVTVRLPDRYAGPNALEALEQLALLLAECRSLTPEEARQNASGALDICEYEPTTIYGGLPALLRWRQ